MKKRVALVRGPNLNSWEMQNFSPLRDEFELVGFTSYGHNFDVASIPFQVRKHISVGQFIRARVLRGLMNRVVGDYHDLLGLAAALKGFDILHCAETSYYCTYQAAKAKQMIGGRLVVTLWENIPFLYHLPVTQRNKEFIFAEADLFLPVSERAKEVLLLEGAPKEKVKVQMPGIDTEHFRPMEKDAALLRQFDCKPDDLILLFVANLYREKGVFDLLFAFRRLLDDLGPERKIRLLIAGKGREHDAVASLINQLRLQRYARLVGSYAYTDMPRIHNLADVFVLPSAPVRTWQEQFGYVLIESMACGKPVISTLSGSIPEVVEQAGILVPPNDFVSLANAMEDLLVSSQKRASLAAAARARALALFDVRHTATQFRQHYNSVLTP